MPDILQFSRPETVGVNPEHVIRYVEQMNRQGKMCHSFLMVRHGKVFAEGYWKPFHADWLHRQYSVSKSFVSLAIGLLADDGKIRLTDKIADYFPDLLPDPVHPLIAEMTIRDLLRMATCHVGQTYQIATDQNWLETFFRPHAEPDHPAGTQFRYDTSATHTLDALVQRLTGQSFLEYLKDRVLRDIGFSGHAWCVKAPEGIDWGGSGVMCTTRDLARFGLLVMNQGQLNGKQYLSRAYMEAATGNQIDNDEGTHDFLHGHGYGYQFWRMAHNCFGCLGMGGQLVICYPEKDFLFVCNSDTQGDENYVPLAQTMWDEVASKLCDEDLPPDEDAYDRMTGLLEQLTVTPPTGVITSPLAARVHGVTYRLEENPMGITAFRLELNGDASRVCFQTCRGEKVFHFGMGTYVDDLFPETHYSGPVIHQPLGRGYRCIHASVWQSETELLIRTYVMDDYFGNMHTVFTFDGNAVKLVMRKTAEAFLDEYCGEARGVAVCAPGTP